MAEAKDHLLELRWSRSPLVLAGAGLVIGVLANIVVVLVQLLVDPEMAVALGIAIVVLLGAGGLAVRGVGELWESPHWKSSGCFLCAAAYLGTATVALVNGVPLIFQK